MSGETSDVQPLLARSVAPGREAQTYDDHIKGVQEKAAANVRAMLAATPMAETPQAEILTGVVADAATFHDLGKLDEKNQRVLRRGGQGRLPVDHIDAGVAHLMANGARTAAWLVRAHHKPGLPDKKLHKGKTPAVPLLRGGRRCRYDEENQRDEFQEKIERTDRYLPHFLQQHEALLGTRTLTSLKPPLKGLALRLALSCMVDADHTDSAGGILSAPLAPRWAERLAHLDAYVAALPPSDNAERDRNRRDFYHACRHAEPDSGMVACEGPVGIGKTTAVMAFLLRKAMAHNLRHIFVIAPYSNIINQTVKRLRAALTLEGEAPDEVVTEHHHRADFGDIAHRELAVTWRAPVIVTTAVQFFETLAANAPAQLRKLHQVPGSAIVIDEAHAVLPAPLVPQNYAWLEQLSQEWGCTVVFSSGSLVRYWEHAYVTDQPRPLPDLLPEDLGERFFKAEQRRIRFVSLGGAVRTVAALVEKVLAAPGPRLLILNTVQSAAVVARALREAAGAGQVEHLSTALIPADREKIIQRIEMRLKDRGRSDWTLVATSCVEAGVDFSFRSGFRERFAVTSLIQVGGRINRHGEYDADGGSVAYDFILDAQDGICAHPAARAGASVLEAFLKKGLFESCGPSELATRAIKVELEKLKGFKEVSGAHIEGRSPARNNALSIAEQHENYPEVAKSGRVINNDSYLVVVDHDLMNVLKSGKKVSFKILLQGSVQMYVNKIETFALEPIGDDKEIFFWPHAYDPDCFGFMAGAFDFIDYQKTGFII